MNTDTQRRPTPDTDAFWSDTWPVAAIVFARQLERERDEARESKDRISKRAEAIRCELVEKDKQLEAMREAIKEAQAALFRYEVEDVDLQAGEEMSISVSADDQQSLRAAIAKLKPFLKP